MPWRALASKKTVRKACQNQSNVLTDYTGLPSAPGSPCPPTVPLDPYFNQGIEAAITIQFQKLCDKKITFNPLCPFKPDRPGGPTGP